MIKLPYLQDLTPQERAELEQYWQATCRLFAGRVAHAFRSIVEEEIRVSGTESLRFNFISLRDRCETWACALFEEYTRLMLLGDCPAETLPNPLESSYQFGQMMVPSDTYLNALREYPTMTEPEPNGLQQLLDKEWERLSADMGWNLNPPPCHKDQHILFQDWIDEPPPSPLSDGEQPKDN